MAKKITGIFTVFAGAAAMLVATAAHAVWSTDVNQTVADSGSYARLWTRTNTVGIARVNDVAVDAAGNVYTTGHLDNGSTRRILTAKHDAAGNLLWETAFTSNAGNPAVATDEGVALALGPTGDVYVTGAGYTNGSADAEIVTLRYDGDTGTEVFAARHDSGDTDDIAVDIAVGATDKIYVTGHTCGFCNDTDDDLVLLHYTISGNLVWVETYDNGGSDIPVGLALAPNGDIYVAARSDNAIDSDYFAAQYDSVNGNPVWSRRIDTGSNDRAIAMTADAAGNLFVTGSSQPEGDHDFMTVGFDTAGASLWGGERLTHNTPFDFTISLKDVPVALAVDGAGETLVVAGKTFKSGSGSNDPEFTDITLVKYRITDAALLGVMSYDSGGSDVPVAVAADDAGNVYVTGNQGPIDGRDIVTVRYDDSGSQTAALIYDGGGDEAAGALALGTDNEGLATVHVVGSGDRLAALEGDYTLLKYGAVRPDLEMIALSGPGIAPTDGTMTISDTVRNIKDATLGRLADAGAFSLAFYLSAVQDPDPADLIPFAGGTGTRALSGLASGMSSAADTTVTVPPVGVLVPDTDYWIVAVADPGEAVIEREETNNMLVSSSSVLIVDPPELVPTQVSGPASATAASDITVDYSIDNQRSTDAGSFEVAFVLSPDTTVGDADDIALTGTDTVSGIAGDSSVSGSAVVTVPNTVAPDDYYIGIIVDDQDAILEADETNNTLAGTSLFTVLPIPDLTVEAVDGPPGAVVGTTIDVTNTVAAADSDVTTGFDVAIYLSTDTVIDASDTLLGSRTVTGGVAAGAQDTEITPVSIPSTVAQGVYYIGAIVDSADQITENDETNNSRSNDQSTSVGLPASDPDALPDLVITDVTGPSSATIGDTIEVSATVENMLPEPVVDPFSVGVYLSTDTTITTDDALVGKGTVASLDGNTSTNVTISGTLTEEASEPIAWEVLTCCIDVNGNSLKATNFDQWAASQQAFTGDGAVEMTVAETDLERYFGISHNITTGSQRNMDYVIRLRTNGFMSVYQDGSLIKHIGSYATGDVLRIERRGTTINFLRNEEIRTSVSGAPTWPMKAHVFLRGFGSTVKNGQRVDIQLTSGQSYFLGAIADVDGAVVEVDEDNNTGLQTDSSGSPSSFPVSVQTGASGGGGSGALGPWALVLLLAGLLLRVFLPGRCGGRGSHSREVTQCPDLERPRGA